MYNLVCFNFVHNGFLELHAFVCTTDLLVCLYFSLTIGFLIILYNLNGSIITVDREIFTVKNFSPVA